MEVKGDRDLIIIDPKYFKIDDTINLKENKINNLTFSDYLLIGTELKNSKWKVSELTNILNISDLKIFIDEIEEAYINFFNNPTISNQDKLENLIKQRNTIGRFKISSNSIGIFYLDEVLNYNPKFLSTLIDKNSYSIIKNFIGNIDIYFDNKSKLFHFIGIGNKLFYSNTVSWL